MIEIVIAVSAFVIYFLIVYYLHRRGALKGERLSLYGPFLMLKTSRGKGLLDRLARPRRFWALFGDFSIIACLLFMAGITFMLVWSAYLAPQIPRENIPTPDMMVGIPGLNRMIPLWYGLVALIVAIIIHELSHGILTRLAGFKVKSMGLLFLVIPLGAFVEPDEEELKKSENRKRMRIFASGPTVNIVAALVFALIFSWGFMGSVVPKESGVVISATLAGTPNEDAGLKLWSEITHIEGVKIDGIDDYLGFDAPPPNSTINLTLLSGGEQVEVSNVTSGVFLTSVARGWPAEEAGLEPRMIIASINGTEVRVQDDLSQALAETRAGQTINVTALAYDQSLGIYLPENRSVVLADKYDYFPGNEDYRGKGFMGIGSGYLGVVVFDVDTIPRVLAHPLSGADTLDEMTYALIYYVSLPLPQIGLAPLQSPVTDLYEVSGPLGALPASVFWPLANIFYWLFWINLMVGATNTLPAVPLDGGYVFRDAMDSLLRRLFKRLKLDVDDARRQDIVKAVSIALSLFILFLILWTFIGPWIL